MANELSIMLGVELNESDFSKIQSQIDSLKNGNGDKKIKLEADIKKAQTDIRALKSEIKQLTSTPFKIGFEIDKASISQIDKISNDINRSFTKASEGIKLMSNKSLGIQTGDVQRYIKQLDQMAESYAKTFGGKAGTLDKQSFKYDVVNDTATAVLKLNDALGRTSTIMVGLNNVSKGNQDWNVISQSFVDDFGKASKEIEKTMTFLTQQKILLSELESKAFNQNNPLTGAFEQQARASIETWKSEIQLIETSGEQITTTQQNRLKELASQAKLVVAEQQKAQYRGDKLAPDDISKKINNADIGLDIQIEKLKQAGQYTAEIEQQFANLKNSLGEVTDQNGFDEWNKQLEQVTNNIKLAGEEAKTALKSDNFQIDTQILESQFENIRKKYEEIVSANPASSSEAIEEQFARVQNAINNVNPQNITTVRKEMQLLRTEVNGLQPQTLSQVLSQNLGGVGQYLSRFVSATFVISKSVSTIKSMISEVKSLDTSLMELQKVTDLTGDSLAQFTDKAYNVGTELGRTGKDVVDAVTTFSRAGYDLNESTNLAKSALVMSNVGVDIPNMESAASDMISIMKAYDVQAEESMSVIDKLYNVANKEPLDFGNITTMLVTAGGTLAQTNTTLEQTMGLLTGGFATLRDNSVANGLVMISQRLRGVKEDGEAMEAEFMPKLKKAFGDVGIDIETQNGELRSTYDILNDLAGKWDELDSKQRQYLGEKAAGKYIARCCGNAA